MNIQKIFDAVRNEPDQITIIIVVEELERQGYDVIINNKYFGAKELWVADEKNELKYLTSINGVILKIKREKEEQILRMHFLDIDSVAFTDINTQPIQYNPDYTIKLFKGN